jgi:hypothetical protein
MEHVSLGTTELSETFVENEGTKGTFQVNMGHPLGKSSVKPRSLIIPPSYLQKFIEPPRLSQQRNICVLIRFVCKLNHSLQRFVFIAF